MAVILEKTNSAYYSCFQTLFKNIVISLAEAKNICLHLAPLKKHIQTLEESEFNECICLLAPLMHVIALIWSNCRYYNEVKIIVLLKQVCNLLIQEVKTCAAAVTQGDSNITLFACIIDSSTSNLEIKNKNLPFQLKIGCAFLLLYSLSC